MPMACIASTLTMESDDNFLLKLPNKETRFGTIAGGGHPSQNEYHVFLIIRAILYLGQVNCEVSSNTKLPSRCRGQNRLQSS